MTDAKEELPEPDYPLKFWNDGYGREVDRDGDKKTIEITNFLFGVDAVLKAPDGSIYFRLVIHPRGDEPPYTAEVEPAVFNDIQAFKSAVVTGRTTWFSGGYDDLNDLREFVGTVDAPTRKGVRHMGIHVGDSGAEVVFPTGALSADGWTSDAEHVYVRRGIGIEELVDLGPAESADEGPERENVAHILEVLPQTRDPERFLPVVGWFYAAPFAPRVMGWTGQFNPLNVRGDSGAGKTSTLETMWRLFGMAGDPLGIDTKFVITATLAASNAIPVWYDEYKPADTASYQIDAFHDLIRKATRGGVEQRGRADQTTERYALRAPVVISGEQGIQGPAERRRAIMTTFREETTNSGTATKLAFTELVGGTCKHPETGDIERFDGLPLTDHAARYYRWVAEQIDEDGDGLKTAWDRAGERVDSICDEYGITGIDDLPRQGLQTVVFGLDRYREFATTVGAAEVVSRDAVDRAVIYLATNLTEGGQRKSHLDEFVELLARASAEDYLEAGEHYTVVNAGSDAEELRVNLSRTYDRVRKYVRDHDAGDTVDLLTSKRDYDERFADAADDSGSYVTVTSHPTEPIARAVGIDLAAAEAQLPPFVRQYFDGARGPDADDDDSDEPGEPIDELVDRAAGSEGELVTATGVVTALDYNPHEDIRLKGTLRHGDHAIDIIAWEEDCQGVDAPDRDGDAVGIDDLQHAEAYTFQNVRLGTYRGAQLTIQPATAAIRPADLPSEPAENDHDDIEGVKGRVRRFVETEYESGDEFTVSEIAGQLDDISPTQVGHQLTALGRETRLVIRDGDEAFERT